MTESYQPEPGPPNPRIKTWIEGRPVVGAGVVVMGRTDASFVLALDNLNIEFVFVPDAGALGVDVQYLDGITMRVRFTGTIAPFGASYELPNIASFDGYWVHLSAMIYAISDAAVVRQISYTLTASEQPL